MPLSKKLDSIIGVRYAMHGTNEIKWTFQIEVINYEKMFCEQPEPWQFEGLVNINCLIFIEITSSLSCH